MHPKDRVGEASEECEGVRGASGRCRIPWQGPQSQDPTLLSLRLPLPTRRQQKMGKVWSTEGLQSALDDYRRSCFEAEAAVRAQLRALAKQLQARAHAGGWCRAGPRRGQRRGRANRVGMQPVASGVGGAAGAELAGRHTPEPLPGCLSLQGANTELVCAATLGVVATALDAHTREALR